MKKSRKKNKPNPLSLSEPTPVVIEKPIERIELPENGIKIIKQEDFNQEQQKQTANDSRDSFLARHRFRWNRNGHSRYITGSFANVTFFFIIKSHFSSLGQNGYRSTIKAK